MKRTNFTLLAMLFIATLTACTKEEEGTQEDDSKQEQTVSYNYYMYTEPYFNFGCSATKVKANESRDILSETDSALIYDGENSYVTMVLYSFDNYAYKSSGVLVPYSSSNATLLVNFLSERYTVTVYDDDILFYSTTESVGGGISAEYISGSYYYLVAYIEFDSQSYAPSRASIEDIYSSDKQRAIEQFNNALEQSK